MSTIIQIEENKDPISLAMKYSIRNFGINIRPGKYQFEENKREHIVFLNAIVSNEISPYKKTSKSFVYIFKNIGKIIFDEDLKLLEATLSNDLETRIYSDFWNLHKRVEDAIKDYGINKWGNIGRIRTFLGPLYTIANKILQTEELNINEMRNLGFEDYFKPFIDNELIEVDPHNENKLICSNFLKTLREDKNQFETVSYAVGIIIAKSTNYLVKELNNYSFVSYIDIPKVYYLDAVIYGELINMPIKTLINKYYILGRRPYTYRSQMNLEYIISEIVNAGLLKRDSKKNFISGVEPLFDKVFDFRESLLENITSINEGII
ncbi:MAG: hypothetical protein ACFFDF_13190 [Candidatus Odinarchaeota archaeon]